MSLTELRITNLVQRYARERDRYEKLAAWVMRQLSGELISAAIQHVPTFRSKSPESLRGKLTKDRERHASEDFEPEFGPSLLDLSGVRILLYRPRDLDPSCEIIERLFEVPDGERFRKDFSDDAGYKARHRVVRLREGILEGNWQLRNLEGVHCEVQVATIADHIWNELEHDIRYKTPSGEPTEAQQALLVSLRGQLSAVDGTVDELIRATDVQKERNFAAIASAEDLQHALRARCGRSLVGDLSQLLRLLEGFLRNVTLVELQQLPLDDQHLKTGMDMLEQRGIHLEETDARLVVAALWSEYRRDLADIVSRWRGRPGPLARLIRELDGQPPTEE